jgi:hypothetical protein
LVKLPLETTPGAIRAFSITKDKEIMNKNGISTTTTPGTEGHEVFYAGNKQLVQYDYRHFDGQLFSCVKPTLEECRKACKEWKRKQESTKIEYLGFTLHNSWNSDGWVLLQDKPYDHLGNYETLESVKRSALMYFLMKYAEFKHVVHSMAMYGFGRYHEWGHFETVCKREGIEIPKEIHCSEDTNRSICFNKKVFTRTKK